MKSPAHDLAALRRLDVEHHHNFLERCWIGRGTLRAQRRRGARSHF